MAVVIKKTPKNLIKTKKVKKIPEGRGIINGYFSFNNTILNLSKENGEVLVPCSAGSIGYRGSKKSTSYAAKKATEEIIKKATEYGIYNIKLRVKGVGAGRDIVIKKFLETNSLKVKEVEEGTPNPFNGTRPRKKPRK